MDCMVKHLASTVLLSGKGLVFLALAIVDWLTAKANASGRPYLLPLKVAGEFMLAIGAAWHGKRRPPSMHACTNWTRNACGPSPGESTRSFM
jgi:hypothetical protein